MRMKTADNTEAGGRACFRSSKLSQYFAVIAATLMSFCGGTCIAWTSPAVPLLQARGTLTDAQASWLGSLLSLGAVLGAPAAGRLLQRLGRRGTLLLLGAPFAASHAALLAFRSWPAALCAARLLAGAALGGLCVATPVYIAEVAEDSVRGELGSFLQIMFSGGILYVYLLGLTSSYFLLGVCCLLVPLVSMVIIYLVPETPHYHLTQNRKQDATSSLQWLRGGRRDVAEELRSLQTSVDEASQAEGTWRDLVGSPAARKALTVSLGLLAFQQLSGICAVLYFTEKIFAEAGTTLSPGTCSVVVGVVMLVAAYFGSFLVDRLGRKLLLIASGWVLILSSTTLGTYFLMKELSLVPTSYWWVPLASAVVYIVAYCVGFGPLPWTIMAELLPPNVKAVGGSVSSSFCWLLSFVVTKSFQNVIDCVGMYFTFWLFSLCCLIATLFVYFFVPETKGKSLHQIQEELANNKK